jgi:hypothetical protein
MSSPRPDLKQSSSFKKRMASILRRNTAVSAFVKIPPTTLPARYYSMPACGELVAPLGGSQPGTPSASKTEFAPPAVDPNGEELEDMDAAVEAQPDGMSEGQLPESCVQVAQELQTDEPPPMPETQPAAAEPAHEVAARIQRAWRQQPSVDTIMCARFPVTVPECADAARAARRARRRGASSARGEAPASRRFWTRSKERPTRMPTIHRKA